MFTLDEIRSLFTSVATGNDRMCPLCHRSYFRRRYIAHHIAVYCPEADRIPFPNSVISELYKECTNIISTGTRSSRCTEWSSANRIISWSKDRGLTYEIEFKNGSISYVPATELLKSKSGSALAKLGYRLRRSGSISERSYIATSTVAPVTVVDQVPIRTSIFNSDPVPVQVPQTAISLPTTPITLPVAPLFPVQLPAPSVYPGYAHHKSIDYIISRITLTEGRIKSIKSTVTKWNQYTQGIRSVGTIIDQAENFTLSVLSDTSKSISHRRNTLQNMLVFIRTLIRYERSEFILIKSSAASKFISVELRKLNIGISKVRAQSASLESQKLSGKYISSDLITQVSKKASTFIKLLMDKYWTHENTRFPVINRATRSLFNSLAIQDAKFFQVCLLWKLFGYWTPQRSGRVVSLEYDNNLIYEPENCCYYFKEAIDQQKSSTSRSTALSTHQIPVELTPVLDFNRYFIIPKVTKSTLISPPRSSTLLRNTNGGPPSSESVNLMITRLIRTVDINAPHITCQTLRKLSQTYFYAAEPTQAEIDVYNSLADHTVSTSLLYYKLFINSSQVVSGMLQTPTSHSNIWQN
jgi:hypothetical protein